MTDVLGVIVACVVVALIYRIGSSTSHRRTGVAAGTLFLLTPLLWHQWRVAPSSLWPLVFVTVWLVAIAEFAKTELVVWLVVAGAALGTGIYTSHAAIIMMPVYGLLTAVML